MVADIGLPARYPVQFEVDYPEEQSRWKALLRLPLALPVFVFAYLLQSGVAVAIWATILLRRTIPRWLFDFQVAVNRWQLRAVGFLLLLTDEYPAFEGAYPVRYEVEYPGALSRWRVVVWKFITSLPHFFVVSVLWFTVGIVTVIAWLAILFTGRFPHGLHQYAAGVLRWGARVQAYFLSLTDAFPPFSLAADAGPGGRDTYVICSVIGVLATAGIAAAVVALSLAADRQLAAEVPYQTLRAGGGADEIITVDSISVALPGASDPADELWPFLEAKQGHRFVEFSVVIDNRGRRGLDVNQLDFSLKDAAGYRHEPLLVLVGARTASEEVAAGAAARATLLFELPAAVEPAELRYEPDRFGVRDVVYRFR